MCFSASASFIAGTTLTAIGIGALRNTRDRREVPFAIIPILFGAQQLIEGVIWLTFSRDLPLLAQVMTYIYAGFAYVLWPIYAPAALYILERVRSRQRVIAVFLGAGLIVGVYLLRGMLSGPVVASVMGKHIVYSTPEMHFALIPVLYLAATCVSCFFSSHGFIRMFGVLALVSALAAYIVHVRALVSIWCFFAAILSLLIYFHFRFRKLGGFPGEGAHTPTAHSAVPA